jgi:hypothetical protein
MDTSWVFDVSGIDPQVCSIFKKKGKFFKKKDIPLAVLDNELPLSDLVNHQALVYYGLNQVESFLYFNRWLEENNNVALVYLEDDICSLLNFLHNPKAREILSSHKVFLYWLDPHLKNDVYEKIAVECCGLSLVCYSSNKENCDEVEYGLRGAFAFENLLTQESQGNSQGLLRHYYSNLKSFFPLIDAAGLEGDFSGTPALICGAGPSLSTNVALFSEFKNKGLIFAGGSALKVLVSEGIEPHFTACVDPNEEQFRRMKGLENLKSPCFMIGRSHHEALCNLGGRKIFVPQLDAFPISYWIEEQLGLSQKKWEQPLNVVHVCLMMAYHMGCSPIIFSGLDLSFPKEKKCHKSLNSTNLDHSHYGDYLEVKDIFGNPVLTMYQWIREAKFIQKFVEKHSEVEYLNATEGGMGIKGIENITLLEVNKKLEKAPSNLKERVNNSLDLKELSGSNVGLVLEGIYYSLNNVGSYLFRLQNLIKALLNEYESNGEVDETSYLNRYNNMLYLLKKEVAYEKLIRYQERANLTILSRKYNHLIQSKKNASYQEKWKYLLDEFVLLGNAVKSQVSFLSKVI